MDVLCTKHKLSFPVSHWNEKTGQNDYDGGETVTISPKPGPQTVPDHIRESNTFKEAVAAGHLFEVNVVRPAPAKPTKRTKAA